MRTRRANWEMPETLEIRRANAPNRGVANLQPSYPYQRYPLGKKLALMRIPLAEAARGIGVNKGTLSKFIRQQSIGTPERRRIVAWLVQKGLRKKTERKPRYCPQCHFQIYPKTNGGSNGQV